MDTTRNPAYVSHRAVKRLDQCAVHYTAVAGLTTKSRRRCLWDVRTAISHVDNRQRLAWQPVPYRLMTCSPPTVSVICQWCCCCCCYWLMHHNSWQWQSPPCYSVSAWKDQTTTTLATINNVNMWKTQLKIRRLAHIRINNHKFWH